jgi:hypothetical protein
MTPEKEADLRARYPLVYGEPFLNGEGFRCGDGWYGVLDKLGAELTPLIEQEPANVRARFRMVQVKEKFGGLRAYTDREPSAAMQAVIDAAALVAEETCEECGAEGAFRRSGGWIRTLCDEHEAERQERMKR